MVSVTAVHLLTVIARHVQTGRMHFTAMWSDLSSYLIDYSRLVDHIHPIAGDDGLVVASRSLDPTRRDGEPTLAGE